MHPYISLALGSCVAQQACLPEGRTGRTITSHIRILGVRQRFGIPATSKFAMPLLKRPSSAVLTHPAKRTAIVQSDADVPFTAQQSSSRLDLEAGLVEEARMPVLCLGTDLCSALSFALRC